jgi:hypothetical protein
MYAHHIGSFGVLKKTIHGCMRMYTMLLTLLQESGRKRLAKVS